MLYFTARQSPVTSTKKKAPIKFFIALFIYLIGLLFIQNTVIKLLMVILMPFELYFIQNQALKLYPKLISYKTDCLETAKSIYKSNLIITDLNHLMDSKNSKITHFETLDLEIALSENKAENDKSIQSRKNITKLLQTALLCDHEDERLIPVKAQLQSYFPIDMTVLSAQWPKMRAWETESLWITQHQEIKTNMTQLMCMGDIDRLLSRCTHVLTQNGIDILKKEHVAKIIASEHKHGHALERVWGYAFKIDSADNRSNDIPSDFIYIGAISVFAPLVETPIAVTPNIQNEPLTKAPSEKAPSEIFFKVITFSQESPVYVNAVAKSLNLLDETCRILDQNKLMTFSNKTLFPILHRYAFLTRFNEDQIHRILSLYRKGNAVILKTACTEHALKSLDHALFDYFVDQIYEKKAFSNAFEESKTLVARFDKLKAFVLSVHLVELIALTTLLTTSPLGVLILNLMSTSLLGLALFVENMDSSKSFQRVLKASLIRKIIPVSLCVGLYCLMISHSHYHSTPLIFMGLLFVGLAFIFQYPSALSLRKIAFTHTALNATSGILILIFMIGASWKMRSNFELVLLTQLVMYAMTPMILHDLIKLSRLYLSQLSKRLKA
ncbi:hypothetical protein [Fusibacter sp. 3D3]|uniref:hypothetical protein n=1 Tax=Fusibacter sp. 3D3 TaxID=1048380 RepID=UPI000853E979|nr:hypothetical protein [Fusibacter sp. 3D3]GAU76859.1 hypothetical protein F3D3_1457 [Fusibacter sp. 3D3]